jgi:predicted ester cyclase
MTIRKKKSLTSLIRGHRADTAEGDRQPDDTDAPFPGYHRIDEKELVSQLHHHPQVELEQIEAYERSHQARTRVLNKLHYLRQREPLPGYDALSVEEIAAALEKADLATMTHVRAYERKFGNRPGVLDAVESLIHRRREAEKPADDDPGYHATSYGPAASHAGSRAPGPGQLAANKALVTRFYAEAINARDLDAIERLLSDEFVHNGEVRRRAEQREAVAEFLEAFPDLETESELILAEGDLVCTHQRWAGTHQGRVAGIEPTGRRVEFASTAILRIRDGVISEAWDEVDLPGLLAQLTDAD